MKKIGKNKMKKIMKISTCAVIALSLNVTAEELGNGQLSAKVSTMGLGVEYNHPINPVLSVGFGVNKFSKDRTFTESDIEYQGDIDFQSLSVIANYHPWENGFRLRAGAYYNNNTIRLSAAGNDFTNEIGNGDFTGANVTLAGELSFQRLAPYIGIGYGSEPIGNNNFSFDIDIGVMKSPVKAQLSGTCSINGVANAGVCADFNTELAREQADLTNSTDDIDLYPVISLGLTYRF